MDKKYLFFKRYSMFFIILLVNLIILLVNPKVGANSFKLTWENSLEMLSVIPPIFILLGLMDVWVKRETMIKYMGEGSGIKGILLAFFMGSVAAGPLYAAFPVATLLMHKGSKFSNVLIFIGAWSTTKIPLLLFESSNMGLKFTIIRLSVNIFGILAIAFVTEKLMSKKEIGELYES